MFFRPNKRPICHESTFDRCRSSHLICFKRRKIRVMEYLNSYIYVFTKGQMVRNVKKLGRMWFSGLINYRFTLKALSTVAETTTFTASFCFKRRKTRVTEHLNSYIYLFTMDQMVRNVKKQGRRWFSGSINYRFALKALSTVAEAATLSSSF